MGAVGSPGHGGKPEGVWYVGPCTIDNDGGTTGAFTLPCELISSSSTKLMVTLSLILHTAPRSATSEVATATKFVLHGRDWSRQSNTHTHTTIRTLLSFFHQFVAVAGRLLTVPHVPRSPAKSAVQHLRTLQQLQITAIFPTRFTIR